MRSYSEALKCHSDSPGQHSDSKARRASAGQERGSQGCHMPSSRRHNAVGPGGVATQYAGTLSVPMHAATAPVCPCSCSLQVQAKLSTTEELIDRVKARLQTMRQRLRVGLAFPRPLLLALLPLPLPASAGVMQQPAACSTRTHCAAWSVMPITSTAPRTYLF